VEEVVAASIEGWLGKAYKEKGGLLPVESAGVGEEGEE